MFAYFVAQHQSKKNMEDADIINSMSSNMSIMLAYCVVRH